MTQKPKLIRISTVPQSLRGLLKGQLKFLKSYYEVIGVSSGGEILKEVERNEGIEVIPIEMSRKITPFKDLKALFELYKLFKNHKPFIVHSITPKAGLLSMIASKLARVPIRIHTFTGLIFPSKKGVFQKLLITMDKLLCACATHVYPEGMGVRQDLLNYKITNKPLKVLANGNVNGISSSYFNPQLFTNTQNAALKQQLGISVDDFVYIFVGRLVSDKGINELVQAFKQLQISNSKLGNSTLKTKKSKLVLVGSLETDLDPLQLQTLQEIDNNPNIVSVGWQSDVRPYLAIANALVFPSYREGFPNVVLQAGAMGLPSIVSNINGCNEIIKEGENGTIIPVKNSKAIYKAMKKMVEDKSYRERLQKNARAMIVERYEQQLVWEAILQEYQKLENDV